MRTVAQLSTPAEFSIADPPSVSISADLRKRLPTDALAGDIREALGDIPAQLLSSPVPGYVSLGDDDFSFAEADGFSSLVDRISAGYLGLTSPLILVTVAERGLYLIAAAYTFSPDGSGRKLKRVARHVVSAAGADMSLVKDVWPKCIAEAVRRFRDNPKDDAISDCDTPKIKGAVEMPSGKPATAPSGDAAPAAAAPAAAPPAAAPPAATPPTVAPPASPPAPTKQESKGLLDDVVVPPSKGNVVVIVPPDTPSKGGGVAKPAPRPEPAPNTAVLPEPAPKPLAREQTNTSLLTQAPNPKASESAPRYHLMEQLIAYGLIWTPSDTTKTWNAASTMANRTDEVGQCLGRNGLTKPEIASLIRKDLAQDRSNLAKIRLSSSEELYELIPGLSDRSIPELASYCITAPPLVRPFKYLVYPPPSPPKKLSFAEAEREAKDQIAEDVKESAKLSPKDQYPPRDWRLPSAIEAFAIASVFNKEKDKPAVQMTFWTSAAGLLSINKLNGRVEVDHDGNPPPNTKATTLIIVHH